MFTIVFVKNNALCLWLLITFGYILQDYCKRDKARMWVHYKPSLFQHIGTHSSLKGKVQKLKVHCTVHLLITK